MVAFVLFLCTIFGSPVAADDIHTISLAPDTGLTIGEAYAAVKDKYTTVRFLLSQGTFAGNLVVAANKSLEVIGAGSSATVWYTGGGRHIYSEGQLSLQDLTLGDGLETIWCGGCIQLWQTTQPTVIQNVVFSNCSAEACGGAIDARTAAPLLMTTTHFEGNTGFAVVGNGDTSCTGCTCTNNSPQDFSGFSSACPAPTSVAVLSHISSSDMPDLV